MNLSNISFSWPPLSCEAICKVPTILLSRRQLNSIKQMKKDHIKTESKICNSLRITIIIFKWADPAFFVYFRSFQK